MTPEPPKPPPPQPSVWKAVVMAALAMLIAKACVASMTDKPRSAAHYGGR